jgi:PAS domain S-box-containing protein
LSPVSHASLAHRLRWTSVACSSVAALIGVTALIGWLTGNDLLKGSYLAGITMKANAAVCLALVGLSVALFALDGHALVKRRVAQACAAIVTVVAAATFTQHVFGWNLGIDELLFREPVGAAATQSPNRMGPVASLSLSLLGIGILLGERRTARVPVFQMLALSVVLLTTVPLLGYLFHAQQLFGIARYTGISLPAAAALWLAALALFLSRPRLGLTAGVIGSDAGALLVRRLLPAALLVPPLLMLLRVQGERAGFYDLEFGRALLVLAFIITFTLLVGRTGAVVSRQEKKSAAAERMLRDRIALFLESMTDGFVACDSSWQVTYVNAAAERLSGKSREQAIGGDFWQILPHPLSADAQEQCRRAMLERVPVQLEVHDQKQDVYLEHDVFPTADGGLAAYVRDVSEQRRALRVLAETDRRKNEFLATLAHELRNPLAPVTNAIFLLRRRGEASSESSRAYAIVDRQIAHLTRLIDDLMDVGRISQDKLELRQSRVVLSEIVSAAVQGSRYEIDSKEQALTISLPEPPVEFEGDAVRLVQVLTNLLSNAARYTPRGGSITLSARRDGAELSISVVDSGIGIAAAQMPHIFEMFFQAERENRRGRHGLGIGLALVRKLVELHGGRVSAHSAGIGAGSEFVVHLPLPAAPIVRAEPSGPAPAPTGSLGLRVLVIEDNQDSADMLRTMLEDLGARVLVAYDGETGLSASTEFAPQVVLLDIGLPGMSGYEVARELRRRDWGARALLIALTGWGQADDRARSQAAGFDFHLVKPVNPQQLLDLLQHSQPLRRVGS